MSFLGDLEKIGEKVENFLKVVVSGASTLQSIWSKLSGPTLAAAAAVFYDAVKAISSAESAVAAGTTGNVLGTVTLSETTVGLVRQLVADFKAGEKQVVEDVQALGLKL